MKKRLATNKIARAKQCVTVTQRLFLFDERQLAGKIAEKAPIALQLSKEAVKFASRSNLDEGLRREVDLFAICFSTEDKKEGVAAFLEKRKPVFTGK